MNVRNQSATVKKLIIYSCSLLVALWLFNVLYSVIRNVLIAQSRSEMILALLLLLTTLVIFAFIIVYAWSLFAGLPKIESVCEDEHTSMELREMIKKEYLSRMPSDVDYACMLNMSPDNDLVVKLRALRADDYGDVESFLHHFRMFQDLQEKRAHEVIKKYAKFIALKTAVSPWRVVDMAAVFYNSMLMVCEIAKVYNRRTSRVDAFKLIVGWTINLYVSGGIGQMADGTSDAIGDGIGGLFGSSGMLVAVAPFFSKIAVKAAEGGLNAYLAYRLGRHAIKAFCYLQKTRQYDLRTVLAIQTAEYLCDKFSLSRRESVRELLESFQRGKPLTGMLAYRLLSACLVVRKRPHEKLLYELQLYVRVSAEKVVRASISVLYNEDWSFAPKAFREKFICDRTDMFVVGMYPAVEKVEA